MQESCECYNSSNSYKGGNEITKKISLLTQADALTLLLARLSFHHPQRPFLERELYWTTAGKRGENRIQKKFNEFHFEGEFHILWDVNLKIDNWSIQMDGLLLTRHCAIIIESKNISGQLHFNGQTDEFFRVNSTGEKAVMENPKIQLNKHIRFLTQYFRRNKINLPVSGLVVFTAKDCEFISKPCGVASCKAYQMIDYLLKILQAFPLEAETIKLAKLKKLILTNQTPYKQTPLCSYYFIDPKDLQPGVFCQTCKAFTMQRNKRSWICNNCGVGNAAAHLLALQEYFTFVEPTITNQKLRKFCGFTSRAVATRLLGQLDLERTGESKSSSYRIRE